MIAKSIPIIALVAMAAIAITVSAEDIETQDQKLAVEKQAGAQLLNQAFGESKLVIPQLKAGNSISANKGRSIGGASQFADLSAFAANPFAKLPELHQRLEKLLKKLESLFPGIFQRGKGKGKGILDSEPTPIKNSLPTQKPTFGESKTGKSSKEENVEKGNTDAL